MATYQAKIVSEQIALGIPDSTSPSSGAAIGQVLLAVSTVAPAALFETMLPAVRPTTLTYTSAVQFSFADDFYNRVWAIPSILDFGVITSTSEYGLTLWNANLHPVSLSSSVVVGDSSFGVTSAPANIATLDTSEVELTVNKDGDPMLNAEVIFTFADEIVRVPASGIRTKVWPFLADWSSEVTVNYAYRSEVITSRNGTEQRRALRDQPRMELGFTSLVDDYDFRNFVADMSSWHGKPTVVPDWSRYVDVSRKHFADESVLNLKYHDTWLQSGALVCISWGDPSESHSVVRKIISVTGSSVALSAEIGEDVPTDARIMPAYVGRIEAKTTATQYSERTSLVKVKLMVEPGYENLPSAANNPLTHDGRELFVMEPDWSKPLSLSFETTVETLDYGVGRVSHYLPVAYSDRITTLTYMAAGRDDADVIRDTFRRHSGQQGEFFMPTFTEDLRLKSTLLSGQSKMRVSGVAPLKAYLGSPVYRNIIVFYNDGSYEPYEVIAVEAVSDSHGEDTTFDLRPVPSRSLIQSEIRMICWLPLTRFASDEIAVQWVTDQIANIGLTVKTLPYNEVE